MTDTQSEVDALREALVREQSESRRLAREVLGWWELNSPSLDDPEMVTLAEKIEERLNGDGG